MSALLRNEEENRMKDSGNLHQQVQEMCDCFATSDPLREMSKMQHESDAEAAALKWIGLAVLHGINNNAQSISLQENPDGTVTVLATYRESELPPPAGAIGAHIIKTMRDIIHVDDAEGESTLAFGVRNSSMDLHVKTEEKNGGQRLTISFPA
jgi:hypothetical protein